MLQRSEKGKQARQYFIECEKTLKQSKSQIDLIIESAMQLKQTQKDVEELKAWKQQVEESRNIATEELLLIERSTDAIPEETTRMKIRKIISKYCQSKNADYSSVWQVVYDRLYYRFGINLRTIVKKKGENALDIAEKNGYLDKIYAICSHELN